MKEKWVGASARRKHLAGRRLSRRPDKCDADPTFKVGFSGCHNPQRSDAWDLIVDRVKDIFSGLFFEDSGAILNRQETSFRFAVWYGILGLPFHTRAKWQRLFLGFEFGTICSYILVWHEPSELLEKCQFFIVC